MLGRYSMDEEIIYSPTEEESFLYILSAMIDTLIAQLLWLRHIVDEELERLTEESYFSV
jgi:hypothetical protein